MASEPRKPKAWILAGMVLILLVGLIHLVDAPDSMSESTAKGVTFYANFVGGLVAAFGIWRGKTWGWTLGTLVAAGAFVGYVISRTVGTFGLPPDVWLEPLGVVSLVVEALFVGVAFMVFAYRLPTGGGAPLGRTQR
jgi:hypothetical protein